MVPLRFLGFFPGTSFPCLGWVFPNSFVPRLGFSLVCLVGWLNRGPAWVLLLLLRECR